MATGSYWNLDNPDKPVGVFDPQEVKHIPFDFADWLTVEGTTYVSHAITADAKLSAVDVSVSSGVVLLAVSVPDDSLVVEGEKYGVTVLLTAGDGQKKSQTLWFKIKEL